MSVSVAAGDVLIADRGLPIATDTHAHRYALRHRTSELTNLPLPMQRNAIRIAAPPASLARRSLAYRPGCGRHHTTHPHRWSRLRYQKAGGARRAREKAAREARKQTAISTRNISALYLHLHYTHQQTPTHTILELYRVVGKSTRLQALNRCGTCHLKKVIRKRSSLASASSCRHSINPLSLWPAFFPLHTPSCYSTALPLPLSCCICLKPPSIHHPHSRCAAHPSPPLKLTNLNQTNLFLLLYLSPAGERWSSPGCGERWSAPRSR